MNGIRRLLWLLTAFVFAAVALPANAGPTKKFSITPSATQVSLGSVALSLAIKNETPNGNSNINSLTVNLPAGYSIDTANPPTAAWVGQISFVAGSGGSVSMSNMSPLKPQASFVMTLHLNVSTSAQCGVAAQWLGQAWTGSSFSGDTFAQINVATTTIPANPTAVFSMPPTNVVTGNPVPVSVQLTTCGSPVAGQQVTITVTDASGNPVGAPQNGSTDSSGIASFSIPTGTSGQFTVTATSSGFPTISAVFTVFDGVLNCDPTPPYTFTSLPPGVTDSTQSGYAAGQRGRYNKDGSMCNPVDYLFINSILTPNPITGTDNTVHLIWDTATDPFAAFTYTMTWKTEDVDVSNPATNANVGWPVFRRPLVAWQTLSDGITPIFVPGLACLSRDLPAPYATLNAPVADATSTTIQIAVPTPLPANWATLPAAVPFPIVVGTERMNVTAVSLVTAGSPTIYNLTVVRHNGLPASRAGAWPFGAMVMSTPLPIDPNPSSANFQQQVNICVVNHGWLAAGIEPATGIPQIRYFTTVIDIGDGWVTIR